MQQAAYDLIPYTGFTVLVAATPRGVCSVNIGRDEKHLLARLAHNYEPVTDKSFSPWLAPAREALENYLQDNAKEFNLPFDVRGTEFQRTIWQALLYIPYGETTTYSTLAANVGRIHASRAVGGAVGANPVPILIPCHRVLASGGGLGGFSCGTEVKKRLLAIERIPIPEAA